MSRLRWVILTLTAVSLACLHQPRDTVNDSRGESGSQTTQNETHIAVSGEVMVVGWNDYGVNQHGTAYGYSKNGGRSWTDAGRLPTSADQILKGDPVVAVDNTGTFYFATIIKANGDWWIGVYTSTQLSPEVRFGDPVLVEGSDLTVMQDKPWIAVDPTSRNVYLCWKDIGDGNVRFKRSNPATPTTPLNFGDLSFMNTEGQDPGQFCNIAVGPDGEVYVAWLAGVGTDAQKIYVRKSVNGGVYFKSAAVVAEPDRSGNDAASAACAAAMDRPNMRALRGHIRLADMPMITVDRSDGPFKGTVYIAYSADPDNDGPDDADVFVVRLTPSDNDHGFTWGDPVAVNTDQNKNDNWMPAIAVSSNGTVAVSFYDRRHDPVDKMKIDLYAAISPPGGTSWENQRVTNPSFGVPPLLDNNNDNFNPPAPPCYMGDYNGIAAAGTVFHVVWGDNSKMVRSLNFPDGRPDPNIKHTKLPVP